jgi:hypothetical protein
MWTPSLARLEAMFNDAPGLVHRRQKELTKEMDLHDVRSRISGARRCSL